MSNEECPHSPHIFEQPSFQPQEQVRYQQYDATSIPLTEELLPADSSQSHDIYPEVNIFTTLKEALDLHGWQTRRLEKARLTAKRQRVAERLSEKSAYLRKLFR